MSDLARLQSQMSTYADFLQGPVEQKSIFFLASREGGEENILMQLCEAMEGHPCRQEYSIYWSIVKPNKKIKRWCGEKDITLIPWEEERFLELLATSAYLLSDMNMPLYFSRRPEQVYWNLSAVRDKEARGKKNRPAYEQKVLLWRYSQNFLQSSHIFVTSEADIRLLKEEYRLENVYDGLICRAEGICQLRDLILQSMEQTELTGAQRLPVNKHRVLIQIDQEKRDELREWLSLWLEYADQDKYDVTVVTGRPKDAVDMYKLTELPEHVRIMIRRGYVLSGSQQKTAVREYVDDFWLMSDEERKNGHLDIQKIYESEWRKIFGCASFDTIVLTSMHPLWYLGAEKAQADKVFICTREIRSAAGASHEEKEKWENKWRAMKKMKAVYWFGTEELPFDSTLDGLQKLPAPVPRKWLEGDTGQLTTMQYQDKEYAVVFQGGDWRDLRGQVEFIPLPSADEKAYVASGSVSGILPGFRQLRGQDTDIRLYVFTGDRTSPAEELGQEFEECVVPIGGVVCGDMPGAFDYFQRFRGGLIRRGEESGSLAVLMGILEKPVYRADGGHLEEISIQIDKDSLYMQGKEAVDRIWGE